MKRVKQILVVGTTAFAAFLLYGCPQPQVTPSPAPTTGASPAVQTTKDTDSCMTCHGDNTDLGNKVQNARSSWETSVHAKGFIAPLKDSTGAIIGHEKEGSDSFYANGGACVVCHTKEGFNKQIEGKYTTDSPVASDSIVAPSALTCFTCHKPHSKGNFDLVIPNGKQVTTAAGGVYNKPKGSICVSCHQTRLTAASAEAEIINSLKGSGLSFRGAAHHGPESDMLLGKGGAQYSSKTYGNGAHTDLAGADCVTCHMTYAPEGTSFSGSPNLAGHSFNAVGIVHGAEKGNVRGCNTCHTGSNAVSTANSTKTVGGGHLPAGKAYFKKGTGTQVADEVNQLLTVLMDPDADPVGKGLLSSAYGLTTVATGTITWGTNGRFLPTALSGGSLKDAAADANSAKTRFGKALYNYLYVKEEGSKGIHNPVYTKQLLLDSINDLIDLGATTSATHSVTRP